MNIRLSLLSLLLLVIIGCGPKNPIDSFYVEGVVKLDGEVQPNARIMFHPKDEAAGETASGTSDEQGFYTLTSSNGLVGYGALSGEYIVTVTRLKMTKLPPEKINPRDGREYSYEELLPTIYQDTKNSPLQVTVERKRKNIIDLNMSTK